MASDAVAPYLDVLGLNLYAAVFVVPAVDATGLPVPGRLVLIAAGALSVGRASAVTVVLLAAAGAFVGDHVRQLPGATLLAVVLAAGMTAILLFRLVRRRRHGPATGRRLVSSAENMRHAID